jgi:hypothetical protein
MKNQFDIKIIRQHWIKDDEKDHPEDLGMEIKFNSSIFNENSK